MVGKETRMIRRFRRMNVPRHSMYTEPIGGYIR